MTFQFILHPSHIKNYFGQNLGRKILALQTNFAQNKFFNFPGNFIFWTFSWPKSWQEIFHTKNLNRQTFSQSMLPENILWKFILKCIGMDGTRTVWYKTQTSIYLFYRQCFDFQIQTSFFFFFDPTGETKQTMLCVYL